MSNVLNVFLDVVWLAEHPGDRVVARHLAMLGAPQVPVCVADAGLVAQFKVVCECLVANAEDGSFAQFLSRASDFERTMPIDRSYDSFCREMWLEAKKTS